jgi:methylenetetrahydrofolate dehydrogenase (NADP+)/methenyltetrahydrofolate cyclohydrolase
MIIDGRALARTIIDAIAAEVATGGRAPELAVITCAPNFETQKFLQIKEKQAARAHVPIVRYELPSTVTLKEVVTRVEMATEQHDGLIIQFPFPHIATADLIPLIPSSHDVDVLSYNGGTSDILPPVVGAIDEMSRQYGAVWEGKRVVIVGNGRLVGAPTALYATTRGAAVTVVTKDVPDLTPLRTADIVVLGAGVPGLVTPDMVREGVIVFDAGTSEEGGQLRGDADVRVAEKAALFTPVPGGIGPLTVAVLLRNLLTLSRQ